MDNSLIQYNGPKAPAKKKNFLLLALYDEFALGLRILAALLLNAGYNTEIVMFKNFSLTVKKPPTDKEWELLGESIRDFKPDFIGVSMLSLHIMDEEKVFDVIRKAAPEAIVVIGGFGPTLEPERFLVYDVDYIVRGEGEDAILDMADALENNRDFKKIKNLGWLENGEARLNPLAEQIDLARLPIAIHGREHILYIDHDKAQKIDPMLDIKGFYLTSTSRGCTSHCTYCAGGNWLDVYRDAHGKCKRYRKRPAEDVIAECLHAKELGAAYIFFLDEFFVRPEEEYFQFFEEYRHRVGIPFGLMVHTAFMEKDDARFNVFVDAGVHDVEIGVQSASPHVARDVFLRPIALETQLRTIKRLYDRWVSVAVDLITGHSMESEEDFLYTVDFVSRLPFDPFWPERCHISAFSLALLPGAKIGELYPLLKNDPMPPEEKEFRQRILYLRHIMKEDGEFQAIYRNSFLRKNPRFLKDIFREEFARVNSILWQHTLERINGKEVYFWGGGQSYQTHKHRFLNVKPQGIIIDQGNHPSTIDGLPVLSPDDALVHNKTMPIIIFSSDPGFIATKIVRDYPCYSDLIPCYDVSYKQLFLA